MATLVSRGARSKMPSNCAMVSSTIVWLTDCGANAIVRFDPATETFDLIELPSPDAAVRQLLGRLG